MDGYSFLKQIYNCICDNSVNNLYLTMDENENTIVSDEEFEFFTQLFAGEEREWLQGSVNIHGMGGTGIPKVNLTSIACLYLSVISNLPIAKTGSRKNTGVFGSTDFFEKLKFTTIVDKKRMFEEYGFVYFDYLELSPWKQYKQYLKKNRYIADILERYHFFEYDIGTLGLGVSSQSAYIDFIRRKQYPEPTHCFTFYSELNGQQIDECVNPLVSCYSSKKLTAHEILRMDYDLINGNDKDSCWHWALRESVAVFAKELGIAKTLDEGREMFDKSYVNKELADKLSNIYRAFHI